MAKDFSQWMGEKKKISDRENKPPFFKEGEMWWCHIGENVGSEIDGKGDLFTRPIVIYKKLGSGSMLAIPTSTKQKEGTWYVPFRYKGVDEVALLSQIRIISYKRLKEKIGKLSESEMADIKAGFRNLYL